MIRRISAAAVFATLLAGTVLAGEVEGTAELRKQIEELTRRVEAVERQDRLFQGGESWVDRFKFGGDFTYRHEMIRSEEPDADEEIRHHHRFRMRLNMTATVNDDVSFTLRLTSGTGSATSTFQDVDGSFSDKDINIDQAFARYKPKALEAYGLEATVGKVPNPFFKPGKTQLIWDGDLTPEGGAIKAKLDVAPVEVFCVAGGFCIEEDADNSDNLLFGVQTGVKWPVMDTGITVVAGASGFWFTPSKDEDPFVGTKRNSLNADGRYLYEFNLAEGFAEVHFKLYEIPVVAFGDFVMNTDAPNENTAWTVGVLVGKLKKQWDWAFKYDYRDIEGFAQLDTKLSDWPLAVYLQWVRNTAVDAEDTG